MIVQFNLSEAKWNYECNPHKHLIGTCDVKLIEAANESDADKFINVNDPDNVIKVEWKNIVGFLPKNMLKTFPSVRFLTIQTAAADITSDLFDGGENVEFLDITSNIETLSCQPFSQMQLLAILKLQSQILGIQNEAISCLPRLRKLDLSGNKIRSINGNMFSGAQQLHTLFLQENQIESIESGSFANLPSLEVINLSYNKLSTIGTNVFTQPPKLVEIDLTGNLLESIDFKLPSMVEQVKISHNPIKTSVDVVRFAFSYINLDRLELENTTSSIQFSQPFDSTHGLTTINLAHNDLSDENVIRRLKVFPQLKVINLNGNKYKKINELNDVVNIFSDLDELHIKCNEFECNWLQPEIEHVAFDFDKNSNTRSQCYQTKAFKSKVNGVDCM